MNPDFLVERIKSLPIGWGLLASEYLFLIWMTRQLGLDFLPTTQHVVFRQPAYTFRK